MAEEAVERIDAIWDMSLSREEFLRSLADAVGPGAVTVNAEFVEGRGAGLNWRINLTPMPKLRIGALDLPRLRVTIAVWAGTAADAQAFLAHLARYMQRGGG